MVSVMWVRLCGALALVIPLLACVFVDAADAASADGRGQSVSAYVYDDVHGVLAHGDESPEVSPDETRPDSHLLGVHESRHGYDGRSNPERPSARLGAYQLAPRATSLADDGARFVVGSAGSTTLRAQGPSGWIDVSHHAARRMTQRGISIDAVDQALTRQPFNYWHSNSWKVGYYDASSNVFVGTVNGVATTVIRPSAGPQYIANLLAASP